MKGANSPVRPRTGSTGRAPGGRWRSCRRAWLEPCPGLCLWGRWKPKAGPRRVDSLECLVDGRLVDLHGLAPGVELFLADSAAWKQFVTSLQVAARARGWPFGSCSVATSARSSATLVLTSSMACSSWKRWARTSPTVPRTLAWAAVRSASAAATAAFLIASLTWYGSLSSWTRMLPFLHAHVVVDEHLAHLAGNPAPRRR